MAHEFESGFFAGRAAWHGLGTLIPNTIRDGKEALKLAGLDWPVEKRASHVRNARGEYVEVPDAFHVTRGTDESVLGTVGSDFVPYQNAEMAEWFQPFIDAGAGIETMGSLRGGRRVWALARLPGAGDVARGDTIVPYLLLAHAHDGTLSIEAGLNPIRVVCANTLAAARGAWKYKIKARHTKNAADKIDNARESIARAGNAFGAGLETFRALRTKELSVTGWREYLKRVVPGKAQDAAPALPVAPLAVDGAALLSSILDGSPALVAPSRKEAPRDPRAWAPITEIFECDDVAGRNLWGAVNAVTGFIDHERGRSPESRLESTWFGAGAELRQKAIDVAIEMADASQSTAGLYA